MLFVRGGGRGEEGGGDYGVGRNGETIRTAFT